MHSAPLVVALLAAVVAVGHAVIVERVCIGTNGRMSVPSNREHHYRNLRDRYTNCTYVDGNLELTWLQDEDLDLSFLSLIREVTGYVLISHVDIKRIVLPSLQIIRGRTLFKLNVHDDEFALLTTLSKMHNLELPALRDILAGSVGMLNNYNLCHIKTINWDEIITGPNARYVYAYDFPSPERKCAPCHESCEAGCWGEGPENCQRFSKINCSPQCHQGRCFGPKPRECCHLFCAGGCLGPKQSDCLACRNFYDEGTCKQECPAMQRYDSITYSWVTNPAGKYAYGATCVKNCPEHLLKDNGACVRSCPLNKKAVNGECVPCDGPCPKTCQGDISVHSGNIDTFKDCTVIEGSLTILDHTFSGYQHIYDNFTFGKRYAGMHPDRLEVFSTLKEITGYMNIQAFHESFTNLSYFRNLEYIGGRTLTEMFAALYIVKTSLKSLGLRSLKKVSSGAVSIIENRDLCFADGINWQSIKKSVEHEILHSNNKDPKACEREGLVCDKECSKDGCWGPGNENCLSCANYQMGSKCIHDCESIQGIYKDNSKICKLCHPECQDTCNGPGPGNCTRCKNVRDGPFCTQSCPDSKYISPSNECKECHANCVYGCDGPENTIGKNGCVSCEKAIIGDVNVESCLHKNESCPEGYFYEWVGPQEQGPLKPLAGKAICRRCHPRCKKCTGFGFHVQVCQECTKYKRGEQCEDECPTDHFVDNVTQECVQCSLECRGCRGPKSSDCFSCRNYRIYQDGVNGDNTTAFNCTSNCPDNIPHKIFPPSGDPYCSVEALQTTLQMGSTDSFTAVVAAVTVCVLLLIVVAGIFIYHWQNKVLNKENAVKMTRVLAGIDREDNEPLRPTNVKPNLAKLRIIKEAEMRQGGVMGFGAFGTVYKGVWIPAGENVKVPVAIKVLREGAGNSTKEFLDEAYIMASVEHPNLLKLLGVCMTSQMMLVTQLMPLGCLLDYVRKNKDKIGSKPLLNWCTQIAKGMAYLEEKRLVHRDLAARNVLVQTPNCVKITDFGLAKLLDINEDEYKAAGGKMPIKWLALECIQHRIFTHKSDVWAFGVTVWELFTYGGRPYEHVSARDVPDILEKGERLSQPSICTIDVYMIMIKCWMIDADSRPAFKELADEFAKMSRDPGRYLVIQGDKLMRLPSFSPQDQREMIQSLSSAIGGSEAVVDAEEYLQPSHSRGIVPNSTSSTMSVGSGSSPPNTPTKKWSVAGSVVGGAASMVAESPIPPNWDALRYGGSQLSYPSRHHIPPSLMGSETTDQSKYCTDPMKMSDKDDCFDSAMSMSRQAQIGTNLTLDLPLDEDDYLMPQPPQASVAVASGNQAYMDILDGSKMPENVIYTNCPDFNPMAGKTITSVDNPEYIIGQAAPPAGIARPPISDANCVGLPIVAPNGGLPRYMTTQRSSEEESDHEYYNDFDRLQRELQPLKPLRRNETTV
ncbi:epidermal growth factor receptor isoform X2 [Neocloeon triangulifer]|uniref:epidermal growth factor receptor isoform X2 n=1 Tax=Neocloeon triangulifer TaxID=2078957 RepID=UPI00286EC937|nr:epidermal growth factor receptor isoform X2 [Neocloeon triangulifer]